MISIQSNMLAISANRQFLINDKRTKKTTEKLSSGYRINRAADDAAGLAISEKMRRQIRGLTQGTANAQDGISFAQIADGSMNEVHDLLQRMNELAVKSLNDTCTESDRVALNNEFDQLRTEIDRINYDTQYNDMPVFEEHEDSFYQIAGNRKWDDNQQHIVSSLANELNIRLPKQYNPNEYTLTIPEGSYTTQELMDEIDDALAGLSPCNPGFMFELTDKGYCNINFERTDGGPAEIATVDGSLSYLLYDYATGSSSTNLLGTTVFGMTDPLIITAGQNDELGFYVEKMNNANYVSIKIPAGAYTRSQMIDYLNKELAKHSSADGVMAMEYGSSCIQIKGGDASISITGLKGNMFKLESTKPVYSSVFYDNINYGNSTGGTEAFIVGDARYAAGSTTKILINDTNNTLSLKVNNAATFTEIKLDNKEYDMSSLISEINLKLNQAGLKDQIYATWYTSSPYRLELVSKVSGTGSRIEIDTKSNPVYANAYDALFLSTRYLPNSYDGRDALLTGSASLTGEIKLDADAKLTFNVYDTANPSGKQYTIDGLGGTYTDRNALIAEINNKIQNNSILAGIKDKIQFISYGNGIAIKGLTKDVQKTDFVGDAQKNSTYKKLFMGSYTSIRDGSFTNSNGSIDRPQGSTEIKKVNAVSTATIPQDMRSKPIVIDDKKNRMQFDTRGGYKTITLRSGTYSSMASLAAEMNYQFANSNDIYLKSTSVSYDSTTGKLTFTSTPPSSVADGYWSIGNYNIGGSNSAWWAMLGTQTNTTTHGNQSSYKATLTTYNAIPENITIDSNNNELTLNIGSDPNDAVTITIPSGSYTSRDALKTALQNSIDNSALKDKVTVAVLNDGRLQFVADSNVINSSGSFKMDVLLCKTTASDLYSSRTEGTYTDSDYRAAYIIGRKDLKAEPVEIFAGANDVFTFDFEHTGSADASKNFKKQMDIIIPEGVYTGDELAAILQEKIQEKFDAEGLDDFDIKVTVGGKNTGVVGAIDDRALQIAVERKKDKEPDKGKYVLDGIRGSAASFVFYKTTGKPKETYVVGTKDISKGITFKEGQNVFSFTADNLPYKYTFPENKPYTGQEFVDMLNDLFENGDDDGNKAPLKATMENGALKISHKVVGTHTITDIGGSARVAMFLEEAGRPWRDPMLILVGTETKDVVEMLRTRVSSAALGINTITISKPKYAEKSIDRVKDAINLVSSKRSTYGSMQNRLEHTIDNNNNIIENTQVSEAAIRDTDMAYAVMEQAKNNFMSQASQTIVAQANQQAQNVIDLLR